MPAHAADGVEPELIDVQGFRVDQFVPHMSHQHFADARAFDRGAGNGGLADSALKKLNGAALIRPSPSTLPIRIL
jgi:hypothetical protein